MSTVSNRFNLRQAISFITAKIQLTYAIEVLYGRQSRRDLLGRWTRKETPINCLQKWCGNQTKKYVFLFAFYLKAILNFLVQDSLTEDDDIVAGPQKMSLKCPVSRGQIIIFNF